VGVSNAGHGPQSYAGTITSVGSVGLKRCARIHNRKRSKSQNAILNEEVARGMKNNSPQAEIVEYMSFSPGAREDGRMMPGSSHVPQTAIAHVAAPCGAQHVPGSRHA
jgi:hypothetical protein